MEKIEAGELLSIGQQLARIADALESIAHAGRPPAPNYTRPIEAFSGFDWASINARVIKADPDGPTHVEWGGETWTRRSPVNKFGPSIWYSRAQGKDDDGNVIYLRLITFKEFKDSDPLAPGVEKLLTRSAAEPARAAQTPATSGQPAGAGQPASKSAQGPANKGRQPAQVKAEILQFSKTLPAGKALTDGQKGVIAPTLEACFEGEEDQVGARRAVVKYITGYDSLKDVPPALLYGLYTWLKPYKDKGQAYRAGMQADDEARAILAEIRAGQG